MADKVYIVTYGEYSDYHVVAVFMDRHEAEVHCAYKNGNCVSNGGYRVEEYGVGKIEYKKDAEIGYFLTYDENGELFEYECYNFMPRAGRNCVIPNKVTTETYGTDVWHKVGVMATSREQAEKIAQDLIAKYKAEKEGL